MELSNYTTKELISLKAFLDSEIELRIAKISKDYKPIIKRLFESFCDKQNYTYTWGAKEHKMIDTLCKKMIDAFPAESDFSESVNVFFNISIKDKWIASNFSIGILVSQFDKIINAAKQVYAEEQRIDEIFDL